MSAFIRRIEEENLITIRRSICRAGRWVQVAEVGLVLLAMLILATLYAALLATGVT